MRMGRGQNGKIEREQKIQDRKGKITRGRGSKLPSAHPSLQPPEKRRERRTRNEEPKTQKNPKKEKQFQHRLPSLFENMQTAVSLLFAAPYPNARLQQQLDVLRQHPPALVPVLQRQCQIVRWSSPTSSDEQQRNELRDLIQALTIGPTQVGA
mmetsp:Transcript_25596/g.64211  ORF Transcript_25596/g.64211 Transcript_25596/m.64211 type:complete len:153 (-) Transcript_25596:4827-5285(-)